MLQGDGRVARRDLSWEFSLNQIDLDAQVDFPYRTDLPDEIMKKLRYVIVVFMLAVVFAISVFLMRVVFSLPCLELNQSAYTVQNSEQFRKYAKRSIRAMYKNIISNDVPISINVIRPYENDSRYFVFEYNVGGDGERRLGLGNACGVSEIF